MTYGSSLGSGLERLSVPSEAIRLAESGLFRASLLWVPDRSVPAKFLEAALLVFWVTDLLKPREIVVAGEGLRPLFYAVCQAVEQSGRPDTASWARETSGVRPAAKRMAGGRGFIGTAA
jgi:hypothetical protein